MLYVLYLDMCMELVWMKQSTAVDGIITYIIRETQKHTHIHTYTHTYTHTHIHTHILKKEGFQEQRSKFKYILV